ncbi:DUF721 domain-containing protein [Fimbriimonadia bacterium ATM]|nr:MAG: DUF721 domain-containing protein [Armatimonadota bacterium]MBC6970121.1 DUF721 domain-containing protein [Armatimonadota bacterium]MCE7900524.1 DUF721 domain-containing protein [Armatimonadetes bacterium ATM1]MDL1929594.1 DUF721 domain-containing protein [Fimbriimonadia bacterium ATM]RIJ97073.1 MAG: hypothetical protein DCC45_03265 [Armatimonadota bacterium]
MKRTEPDLLANLLGVAVGRSELIRTARAISVMKRWKEIVGEVIGARTAPERFERGELCISTLSSVWAQEIRLRADAILQRLNEAAGEELFTSLRIVNARSRKEPSDSSAAQKERKREVACKPVSVNVEHEELKRVLDSVFTKMRSIRENLDE